MYDTILISVQPKIFEIMYTELKNMKLICPLYHIQTFFQNKKEYFGIVES